MKRKKIRPASNRTPPLLLIIGGVVILVAVLIYIAINAPTTSVPQSSSISIPFPNIPRVTVEDTKQAYDRQSAVIVDVRDSGSYGAGHVAGSINIPLDELENRLGELSKDSWIITYCT